MASNGSDDPARGGRERPAAPADGPVVDPAPVDGPATTGPAGDFAPETGPPTDPTPVVAPAPGIGPSFAQPGSGQLGSGQAGSAQPGPTQQGEDQTRHPDQPASGSPRHEALWDQPTQGFDQQGHPEPGPSRHAAQTGSPAPTLPADRVTPDRVTPDRATADRTGPAPPTRRRYGAARLVALTLAAALLGGGIGGTLGYQLAVRNADRGSNSVLGAPLPAADPAAGPLGPVEAVAQRVLPSVVQLRVQGSGSAGEGSGMVLSPDGLILTNNHVVADAAAGGLVVAVFEDGRSAPATIVGRDPGSDLAVIRATGIDGLSPVELGDSDSIRVGQQVVAFGSPLGLGGTVTTGIISAVDRAVTVGDAKRGIDDTVLNALQTDAAINPGNSGGPLVDMQGRVVGINSAIATTGGQGGSIGVGFSIPINQARRIAQELVSTGRATRAVLGVDATDDPNITGARIRTVTPGGAADLAGIRVGDVVVRLGNKRVATGTELQAQVRAQTPGGVVPIELSDRTVEVTMGTATG